MIMVFSQPITLFKHFWYDDLASSLEPTGYVLVTDGYLGCLGTLKWPLGFSP